MTNSYSIQSPSSTQTESSPVRRRITPVLIQPTPVQVGSNPVQVGSNPVQVGSNPVQVGLNPVQVGSNPVQVDPVPLPSVPLLPESTTDSEASGKECIICYESLSTKKNLCITECGHEFCFSCMMKHVQRNNGCPICRSTIIDDVEDSESENDDEYSEISGSEEYSDEETVDGSEMGEDDNEYTIEQFEEAFTARGYRLKDALSLLMYKFSKTDEKYTKSYIKKLEKDIDNIHEELQQELNEREEMAAEDTLVVEPPQPIQ